MFNIFLKLGTRAAKAYLRMYGAKGLKGSQRLASKSFASQFNTQPSVIKQMAKDRVRFNDYQTREVMTSDMLKGPFFSQKPFTLESLSPRTVNFMRRIYKKDYSKMDYKSMQKARIQRMQAIERKFRDL